MPRLSLALGAIAIAGAFAACTPAPQRGSSTPAAPTQPRLATPTAPAQPPPSALLPPALLVPQRSGSPPPGLLNQPSLAMPSASPHSPPAYTLPPAPPPAREPAGRIVQAPSGLGVTSGGTQGYQTMTTPGGG